MKSELSKLEVFELQCEVSDTNDRLSIAIETLKEIARNPVTDPGEYWDSGNFDDCYEIGVNVGEGNMGELARNALILIKDGK